MPFERTLVVVAAFVMVFVTSNAQLTFEQYLQTYKLSYPNPVEYAYRKSIYQENLKRIIDSQKPPLNSYSMRPTKYMTWT